MDTRLLGQQLNGSFFSLGAPPSIRIELLDPKP